MRCLALCVGLTGAAGCSLGNQAAQDAPVAQAAVAQAAVVTPAVPRPASDPVQEAAGPDFQGVPEVERRFQNGLVTQDFRLGEGPEAEVGSRLTLRYAGILNDGSVFDDNRASDMAPFRFRLPKRPRVRGWGLGLLGMKAKGRRKILVPAKLGYGKRGQVADEGGVSVPPNAELTYVVELLSVEPPPQKPHAPQAFTGSVLARKRHRNGLVTEDFKLGTGPAAKPGDRLAIYYRGYLQDGTLFDASLFAGAPFEFQLGDRMVIPGWNQGMAGMKPGGLRTLTIPAKLAYAKRGAQGVPPNAKLKFTVELVALRTSVARKPTDRP